MISCKIFAFLYLFTGAVVAAQAESSENEYFSPTRYIVEFSDSGSARFRKRDGGRETEAFINMLQDRVGDVEPAYSFTSSLFHGASFDLNNATEENIASILNLPEVANVWPASFITLGVEPEIFLNDSRQLAAWDPHKETNVSLVHELGNLGEGVVVAVVDSGIDYTHPALGGGFGPGFKVDGGWDFVNNSPDPIDCFGHGTHVAGIVGADDVFIKGVAPKATLRAYKVFGCSDGTTEDMAIAAFLRAYEEGADVINGSLGADRGFPDNPIAIVLSRIQAQGVLIVVAAGNSGAQGPFFTTSLGNNFGGLTVGSIEQDALIGHQVTAHSTSGESRTFVYVSSDAQPFRRSESVSASWVPGSTREYNACFVIGFTPTIPNDNLIVLPWQSHDNRLNNRVDWVFWYNRDQYEYEVPTRNIYNPAIQPVGSALISYEDGDWLVSQHESGYEISYVFNSTAAPLAAERPSWAGGRLNSFSSWGPTIDGRTKPEIVAPGGSIFSTYLGGGWVSFSGTSMASPYAAGLAALVLEQHGTRSERDDAAAFARQRIIASTRPINHPDGSGVLASIGQQGTGLVDAVKAVLHSTSVNPSYLQLNDTDHFRSRHEISLTNEGEEEVTYQLSHSSLPTYFTRNGGIHHTPAHSSESGDVAEVELSLSELTLGPGETAEFEVAFTEPAESDPDRFPVYGGAIVISGDNGENVRVTYMGIKGSINNFPHWGGDSRPFLGPDGQSMTEGGNYSFNDNNVPYAPFSVIWSTREFSFDFVDRDWTPDDWSWPPVAGENNFYGSFRTTGNGFDFVTADFPIRNFPRFPSQFFARPTGTFSSGEQLLDGEYRYLRRSLKTFGDPKNISDWQWDVSPWFRVQRGV